MVFLDSGKDTWAWIKNAEDETTKVGDMAGCYKDWGGEHQISKKLLDEAEQWLLIFERAGLYSKDNVLAFDWESLHKKGLEIAIKLNKNLKKSWSGLYFLLITERLNEFRIY